MSERKRLNAPRLWFPMDALFKEQDTVERLEAEYGPSGPWVFVWLLCEAYKRFFLGERPGGVVNMSYERLVAEAGVVGIDFYSGDELVRATMRNLEDAQILEFVEGGVESATFRVRFSKWSDWLPNKFADPTHRAKSLDSYQSGDASVKVESIVTLDIDVDEDFKGLQGQGQGRVEERAEVARLSHLLADLILKRDPKAKVAPDAKRWLDSIRLLLDRDGREEAEVEHVIRWCQADGFWRVNILSAPKLREKFDALYAKAGKPKGNADDFFKRNGM